LNSATRTLTLAGMSYQGRRFPPPWTVKAHEESFSVRDAADFPIAWVYFTTDPNADHLHTGRMTRDQARRVAANIAKLPVLLGATPGEA
jgi:hypothetical protein